MPHEPERGRTDAPARDEHQQLDHQGADGGLHYQQARRHADQHPPHTEPTRTRPRPAPDQQQAADDHGAPDPEDESWLQDQGYPKLGHKMQSRVTQVEHGPYAGGTQQGAADSPAPEKPASAPPARKPGR